MPFESEKTLVVGYVDAENNDNKQIAVSTLPEHIQVEIEIFDRLRQELFDSYHVMNKQDLAFKAQQMRVQQMVSAHVAEQNAPKSSEEQSEDK